MTVLIQDGRRGGHLRWAVGAVTAGVADGVIVSPFSTPRVPTPRHSTGVEVADAIQAAGGEVFFDAQTHARFLAGTNNLDLYDTWGLWRSRSPDVRDRPQRIDHVERVLARQQQIGVQPLAPTLALDAPAGPAADAAIDLARVAAGVQADTAQSLAGLRSFWRAGARLDSYVGQLAQLRAPTWVVTVVNEVVTAADPEMSDTVAFAGLCRTVHSLSERSRVIVAQADYSGLPAVAAGADTVGSGWDRAMKTFDPLAYQVNTPGIRIPASYVTQGGLSAVLRRDTGDAIERIDPTLAQRLRWGPMPANDAAERLHHLHCLRTAVDLVANAGAVGTVGGRASRVTALSDHYDAAHASIVHLRQMLPIVKVSHRQVWIEAPREVLRSYAAAEGLP